MIRVLPMLLALVVLLAIASWGVRWAAARAPRLTTRRGVRGPGGYGFDRRSDQVKRRLQGVEGPDERRDEITTFLDVHRGVEAYVEPKTVMSPRSVVLVDADGHWRRFDLREDAFLRRVAAERGARSSTPPSRGTRPGCDGVRRARRPAPADAPGTGRPTYASPMRRFVAGLAGATLLAAACTAPPAGPTTPAGSLDALPGVPHGDRLLVLTDDGTILTISPGGDDPVVIRRPGRIDVEASQPVWAPDGSAVSWVELPTGGPAGRSMLMTSPPQRSRPTAIEVDAAMFYLHWDPTSRRIGYLGSFQGSIGFGVAEPHAEDGPVARTIGQGQPFYVSWSPDGDRLLVHVGAKTLGRLDLEGRLREIGDRPGLFHAPVWLDDGRLVYVSGGTGRQSLVVRDGRRTDVLLRFRGAIEFVVDPGQERIAYRVDAGDGFGGVSVVRIGSGRSTVVADIPAVAFEWSPDGRRLLVLAQADTPDFTTHRWHVWDGRTTEAVGTPFLPSVRYVREYLPFFGQYAQTMSLWAPDGRSFAFPGLIDDRGGIWVQDLDAAEPSFVLEGGSMVAWSPVAL